ARRRLRDAGQVPGQVDPCARQASWLAQTLLLQRRMRLQVGGVYEGSAAAGARSITYPCLEECEAETVRFKKKEPGYKRLVLHVDVYVMDPGDVLVVPRGAHITVGVRRLD